MTLAELRDGIFANNVPLNTKPLLIVAGALCLLIVILLVVRGIRARCARNYPTGSITSPGEIQSILRLAADQRRPFEVQVRTVQNGSRRPTLRCSPLHVGHSAITLELNGIKTLSSIWLDRAVNVYFRIGTGNNKFVYYTFTGSIHSVLNPSKDICQITLPVPTQLDNRQKRAFLRMQPPAEFLLGAALWHDHNIPGPENISDLALWPRPTLLFLPGRLEQFKLLDLSAGGLRICIPHMITNRYHLEFSTMEDLIMMIDLLDPEIDKRLRFWMQCRIQNAWEEQPSHDIHTGMQFRAWARPRESQALSDPPSTLEWFRLSSSFEVESIGNWVMRRHLEMYRDVPNDMF